MEIALHNGMVALIDDEDYPLVSPYNWFAWRPEKRRSGTWYALANRTISGRSQSIAMHRLILDFPPYRIDHIDLNGLNNQRSNLRRASAQQNSLNQRGSRNSTSPYKGVSFDRRTGRWMAQIMFDRHQHFLGRFTDEEAAARAYDKAAREKFGEFAYLNFPEEVTA